jgi:threonine synthase
MSVWRYADWIDPVPASARLTLGEGNTPLVRSRRIGPAAGLERLFFKLETTNPNGSYKDRFAAVALSRMLADGKTCCLATSSGNTGAALAAYCAAAGLPCVIVLIETTPRGKLLQMLAHGAHLARVRGFGSDPRITAAAFELLSELGGRPRAALQISAYKHSPVGMSGVKTISYELAEQSGARPIDHVFAPAGGGGLILAVARGFEYLRSARRLAYMPRVECVQPEGNNTIAGPLSAGLARSQTVECSTRISGLQVPSRLDGDEALVACRRSRGMGHWVSDERIWRVQARLAREEGIFCEPAGAVALAGALQAREAGRIDARAAVVCVVTGSGFKDPVAAERMAAVEDVPTIDLADLENFISGLR